MKPKFNTAYGIFSGLIENNGIIVILEKGISFLDVPYCHLSLIRGFYGERKKTV